MPGTHPITAVPPARRARRDLVHPAGESPAAAASVRIETPSARAEASAQARSRSACSRRQAARDTRCSTRRSRRQAAIRSVIVTLTPLQVFSELDSQRRFGAPLLPAPRVGRRRLGRCGLVRKGLFVSVEH